MKDKEFYRAVQLMIEREEKDENFQDGKKEGFILGMKEGKSEMLMSIMQSKYPNEDMEWIKECDDAQLSYIQKILLIPMEYKEFCQKLNRR